MEKKLQVSAIKDGTVIDHIPTHVLFKVMSILKLDQCENMITFANNLESKVLGKKGIIKISQRFFEDSEIDKIALIAPNARLNTIRDYDVVDKRIVKVPDTVKEIVRCFNPKCITNCDPIPTSFKVVEKNPVSLKCHYCEKITAEADMEII